MARSVLLPAVALVAALSGCESEGPGEAPPPAVVHFPRGDAEDGKAAFRDLKCYTCHRVDGVEMPPPTIAPHQPVLLGGRAWRSESALFTAIVHPSHGLAPGERKEVVMSDGLSRMGDFSHTMTVRELIDIVAFLKPRYAGPGSAPAMERRPLE